jgi:hypothetical protein
VSSVHRSPVAPRSGSTCALGSGETCVTSREGSSVESDPRGMGSSVNTEAAAAPQRRITTRSQHGITKPKVYTDGTNRYGLLSSVGEPTTIQEAMSVRNQVVSFLV